MPDWQNFLSEKPSANPLSVEGSFFPNEVLCQPIQNFYVPYPPRHFLYKRQDRSLSNGEWYRTEHGRSKDSRPEKPLRFP
jgi:hypothetical protein